MTAPTRRPRNDASGTSTYSSDDRGAAFVEFILAIPFLMIMVFGVVETGLGWRAVVQIHSAVRAGARVASHDGANGSADFDTLAAIKAALPSDLTDSNSSIKIIIFNAGSGTGAVPNSCLLASTSPALAPHGVGTVCNVYDWNNLTPAALVASNFGGQPGKYDSNWDPTSRNVNLSLDNMDYLGVYIETKHHIVTKMPPWSDMTIKRQVVFRLEPKLGT